MKKQHEKNKMSFNKLSVSELNSNQLMQVIGGEKSKILVDIIIQTTGHSTWLMVL
ncbi:MAG TPA: class I lanthipeptide [Flavobacterium sp.]|jgi:hypothetical protein|nr:class I lanthipeptide [Flavobacterium sp.]